MFSIMSRSSRQRMLGAFVWVLVAVFVFSLLLGICYCTFSVCLNVVLMQDS